MENEMRDEFDGLYCLLSLPVTRPAGLHAPSDVLATHHYRQGTSGRETNIYTRLKAEN